MAIDGDALAALRAHIESEGKVGVSAEEATLSWAEWAYNLGRAEHTGGTIRDSHLAGIKAVWDNAQAVARAEEA